MATHNLLKELGQPLAFGRDFTAQEQRDGSAVAVVSYSLWRELFPAQPFAPNAKIRLDGAAYTVIGVLKPKLFFWTQHLDFVLPLRLTDEIRANTQSRYLVAISRIRPGSNFASVQAALEHLSMRLAQQHPESNAGAELVAAPLLEYLVAPVKKPILLISGAVAFFF